MISILGTIAATAWAWLSPLLIKHGVKIGIAAGVIAGYFAWEGMVRKDERSKVVQASKQEGRKRNADAEKVRQLANSPGSNDRLRRDWCRDC